MKKVNFVLFHSFERDWFIKNKTELKSLNTHIVKLIDSFQKSKQFKDYNFEFKFLSLYENQRIKHKKNIDISTYKVNLFKKIIPFEFSFSLLNEVLKLDSSKKEIWHLNTYYYIMFDFMLPLLKLKKQKVVVHHRGGGITLKSFPYTFFQYFIILPILLRFVDKIIVQNKYEYNRLIKWYFLNPKKIEWIPNGVDRNLFKQKSLVARNNLKKEMGIDKRDFVLLFVGRLEKSKGIFKLVEIIDGIKNDVDNLKIIIAGSGPDENEFINLLKKRDILKYFIFKGHISNLDLIKNYNVSDTMLHLNTMKNYEGSPNVVLEAQSCGLPVIGFDVPGVQDSIINGKSGFIINVNNLDDYKRKILKLYLNKESLKLFILHSNQNIKNNFNILSIHKKYLNIYERLVFKNN